VTLQSSGKGAILYDNENWLATVTGESTWVPASSRLAASTRTMETEGGSSAISDRRLRLHVTSGVIESGAEQSIELPPTGVL
jgi:hypothetical protein